MAKGNVMDQRPEEILEHVQECLGCKVDIMKVLELLGTFDNPPNH